MPAELAAAIEDLGSPDSSVRVRAESRLEAAGHEALHALVDALQSPTPRLRQQAARLLVRLVQQYTFDTVLSVPLPPMVRPDPAPIPESIPGLVAALRNPGIPYRETVEERLLAQREAAIPALIQGLHGASPIHASRIVQLLTQFQAVEAIPVLMTHLGNAAEPSGEAAVVNAVNALIEHLPERWQKLGIEALVTLLKSSPHPGIDSRALDDAVALGLARAAHEAPTPMLLAALPYLKRPWYKRPASFELARRSIEEATATWKDLPLPTDNQVESGDLPLPAQHHDEEVSATLPYPAGRD